MARRDDSPVKLLRKRLDADALRLHLRALADHAPSLEIRIKTVAAGQSEPTADSLDVIERRLLAGELVAVQIRFYQDDHWWSDTVMAAKDGFRLVRMREEQPPGAG
jgi:hypothetical protein